MKNKKLKVMTVALSVSLLLGACGGNKYVVDSNNDEIEKAINITYRNEMISFVEENSAFIKKIKKYDEQELPNAQVKKWIREDILNYILYLQSHNPTPLTNTDYLMHEHYVSGKFAMEQFADNALKYVDTKEKTYYDSMVKYYGDYKYNLDLMGALSKK